MQRKLKTGENMKKFFMVAILIIFMCAFSQGCAFFETTSKVFAVVDILVPEPEPKRELVHEGIIEKFSISFNPAQTLIKFEDSDILYSIPGHHFRHPGEHGKIWKTEDGLELEGL